MSMVHILSSSSAAGKTVWSVGLIRALLNRGLRVAPFKAISEDKAGFDIKGGRISISALHLIAAARLKPDGVYNPILIVPVENNMASVYLKGTYLGEVPGLGRDTYFLDNLGTEKLRLIRQTVFECLRQLRLQYDVVVSEVAGSAVDLTILD